MARKQTFEVSKTYETAEQDGRSLLFRGATITTTPSPGGQGDVEVTVEATDAGDYYLTILRAETNSEPVELKDIEFPMSQAGEMPIRTDFDAPNADEYTLIYRGGIVS